MRRFQQVFGCVAVGAVVLTMSLATGQAQDDDDKARHTIKDVMKAHKGDNSLLAKVKSGNASDAEKKELVDLYISLYESDPPKGDKASWKRKSGSVLMAAAKVMVGREGATADLTKATACAGCHKEHKPK